jgi:hypothetical protein
MKTLLFFVLFLLFSLLAQFFSQCFMHFLSFLLIWVALLGFYHLL